MTPFIQRLLDQPNSSFKHTPQAAASETGILDAFKSAIADKGILPPRTQTNDEDPRLHKLDTSVLVTGNLARTFPSLTSTKLHKAIPLSMVYLQQLVKWAGLSHETFNSEGLVRMLWWLPDDHKAQMIPRMSHQVSGFNVGMQLGAQLTEVVGVEPGQFYTHRNHTRSKTVATFDRMLTYDAEVSKMVRRKMYEAGMSIPPGRNILGQKSLASHLDPATANHGGSQSDQKYEEMKLQPEELKSKNEELKFLGGSAKPSPALRSPVKIRYHCLKSLRADLRKVTGRMEGVFADIEELGNIKLASKAHELIGSWLSTIEYPQSIAIAHDYYRYQSRRKAPTTSAGKARKEAREKSAELSAVQGRLALLLDLELRIISLEVHYKELESRGAKIADLKPAILKLGTDLREHPMANRIPIPEFMDRVITDEMAFFSNPLHLAFDRRTYEPLHAPLTSFWPRLPLSLIDVVPTGRDLAVPGIADSTEATRTASYLLKYLFAQKTHPLSMVLDKIAPNAAQDLIPQVPALSDPRKGGRLDPGRLLVRMLNEEMVEGLVKAWFEWPFKPRLVDLFLDDLSSSGGEEEEAGEGVDAGLVEE